jgi:hypothetical protein
MTARIWKSALALGAVLAVSGAARAADSDTQHLTGGKAGGTTTTMTLGGKGTVAQNATGDTELTRGFYHHGGWGGYHGGWGGGWGHRGYYGGYGGYGYRGFGYGGWGGYYGGYRPYYYGSYYRPYYGYSYYRPYYSSYSYPYYSSYYGGYGGWGGYGGYGCGTGFYIGISGGAGTNAPAVNLGSLSTPKAEGSTSQPIFGKASTDAPAKTEYRYKAYGEK